MQKVRSYFKEHYPLLLSFWGPLLLMLGYFIFRKMYPFGTSSILTVDMGQQYVDFFQFFRRTLLTDPSNFFYSFSKAIGGEMLGEWAYYLCSPFNLLILLFPGKSIMAGIIVITLCKYACASYCFGRLLLKRKIQTGILVPTFSTAYAFMGWAVANQLNLLWLDVLVFLPLIILGLLDLMDTNRGYAYTFWLAALLFINYYMAYMVCLFLILFFAWYALTSFTDVKKLGKQVGLFVHRSLLAAGLAAFLLIPTFISLKASKGQYTTQTIHFKWEYFPPKMLTKLVLGAFDFKQMPSGYPNIFVGSLVLFAFLLFFFNRRFKLSSRLAALALTGFLLVSMCFEPLDLMWHGFQFPVWYPYRFSFLLSFWMVFLAAQAFNSPTSSPKWWQIWGCFFIEAGILGYSYTVMKKVSYLNRTVLIFSALFAVAILLLLSIKPTKTKNLRNLCLYLLVLGELVANVCFSLNNISYLTAKEYSNPSQALTQDAQSVHKLDNGFYRTGQTYSRTRNDGLALNFNSGSYFSSALEKAIPDFYGQIGNPDGDNYVSYSNGTLISDSLLDMTYFFNQKDSSELEHKSADLNLAALTEKQDLNLYRLVKDNVYSRIYQNPYASGIGYLAGPSLKSLPSLYDDPVTYQTNWLNAVTNTWPTTKYFTAKNFNEVVFQNTSQTINLTGATLKRKKANADAQVIFKFVPQTNNSYYLTLGTGLNGDNVSLFIGNRPLSYYSTFRHTTIVNIANHAKGQEIVITARFKKQTLSLNNFVLYELNNPLVISKLKQVQAHSWRLKQFNNRKLSGTITVPNKKQLFTTTIPYSQGWQAKVDGKAVKTFKVQGIFLALNLPKGKHTVSLSYWPPYFNLGLALSILSLILIFIPTLLKMFLKQN